MSIYTSIDLFAGIGGIRLGFKQAFKDNITTILACEIDKKAQETYRANFRNTTIIDDITQIKEKDIPSFDICLAGFPCQAFSIAGAKKGFKDNYKGLSRGTLFFDIIRICEIHKPKIIFCENVKGLLNHDKGNTFEIIINSLKEIGYNVYYKVLNSLDFGVAQNRERIYIVAIRCDIDNNSFNFPDPINSNCTIKDIIEKEPVGSKYYLSETYINTLKKHKERHLKKGNGFGYIIRDLDSYSGALICGGMGRERNLIIDKRQTNLFPTTNIKGNVNIDGIRKLTPREWARLQGFDDDFALPVADTHLYKQLGNSVTIPAIKAIAKKIKEII